LTTIVICNGEVHCPHWIAETVSVPSDRL